MTTIKTTMKTIKTTTKEPPTVVGGRKADQVEWDCHERELGGDLPHGGAAET